MYQTYRNMNKSRNIDIASLFKQVLEDEKTQPDPFLTEEDLDEILSEEWSEPDCRTSIFGFPTRPLHRELGNMLQHWFENRNCPVLQLPKYDLLDEKSYDEFRAANIKTITPMLEGLESLWETWTLEERKHRLRDILKILGKRGLLDLLGIRKTVGTAEMFPSPRLLLEKTFHEKHNPKSELTVGARALAKHYHRDNSNSWWGICTGKEHEKNEHATETLKKIMDGATWINIHSLPHDVLVIECRQENGYGARWTHDGKSFRGFLEPQMVDGHEVGWRH